MMASTEEKRIRFSRAGAVDWELKKKYFSVKSSRMKALKKWENSRYYPPREVQDRINRLVMTNHTSSNGNYDIAHKDQGLESKTFLNQDRSFVKGLIIRMRIKSPLDESSDEPNFRKTLRSIGDKLNIVIAYIDLKNTSETLFKEDGSIERSCFIRLNSPEDAKNFLDNLEMSGEIISKGILIGEDETSYWNRMKDCQDNQRSKKRRHK